MGARCIEFRVPFVRLRTPIIFPAMTCPHCGAEEQTGKFCAECGAGLDATCPSCGAAAQPGARYCTRCGTALAGDGAPARSTRTIWLIAGAALLVVALMLLLPRMTDRAGPPSMTRGDAAPAGGAPGAMGGDGLLSNDMRTNADRLFNRVMAAAEQGDQAQVDQFMPMAVQAYGMVDQLDDDGTYHLAILHLTAGQPDAARETAGRILDGSPDHILALGVAAEAAAASGDDAEAERLYRRLLDAYATEAARPLPEYVDHERMLTEYRRQARDYLDEG